MINRSFAVSLLATNYQTFTLKGEVWHSSFTSHRVLTPLSVVLEPPPINALFPTNPTSPTTTPPKTTLFIRRRSLAKIESSFDDRSVC